MKIGDKVYVQGYVDEIRNDTVIIRNDGGYFGTVPSEVITGEMPERKIGNWVENSPVTMRCDQCGYVIRDWFWHQFRYCPNCGVDMKGEQE